MSEEHNKPHEEIIFHFTNQNVNLKLLTDKIVEYLKKFWPDVETRYNKVANCYEITAFLKSKIKKMFAFNHKSFIIIRGQTNDFTICFFLPPGGILRPAFLFQGAPGTKDIEGVRILRKVENFVYELANTSEDYKNPQN